MERDSGHLAWRRSNSRTVRQRARGERPSGRAPQVARARDAIMRLRERASSSPLALRAQGDDSAAELEPCAQPDPPLNASARGSNLRNVTERLLGRRNARAISAGQPAGPRDPHVSCSLTSFRHKAGRRDRRRRVADVLFAGRSDWLRSRQSPNTASGRFGPSRATVLRFRSRAPADGDRLCNRDSASVWQSIAC